MILLFVDKLSIICVYEKVFKITKMKISKSLKHGPLASSSSAPCVSFAAFVPVDPVRKGL